MELRGRGVEESENALREVYLCMFYMLISGMRLTFVAHQEKCQSG